MDECVYDWLPEREWIGECAGKSGKYIRTQRDWRMNVGGGTFDITQ